MTTRLVKYDIIAVGGGIGGASLAKAMAEAGAKVLVLERTTRFADRVRGESMHPWGVAEVHALDLWDTYQAAGAHELPYWYDHQGASASTKTDADGRRHLPTTTPSKLPEVSFYHPAIQEALLRSASDAGAEVWRGATVGIVTPGELPSVTVRRDGRTLDINSRLVVGADGRTSAARRWGGFQLRHDPVEWQIAGLLFDNLNIDDTCFQSCRKPPLGGSLVFPQGNGRVRVYFEYPAKAGYLLSGRENVAQFMESCIGVGVFGAELNDAIPAGPLASFNGSDSWVDHPYRSGVALIGDAATAKDPRGGMGTSLTSRDVRVLRDKLLSSTDWDQAGHAFAVEHDHYYGVIRTLNSWRQELNIPKGSEADAWRAKLSELHLLEPGRVPDITLGGPDMKMDESARRRFFGEDVPEFAAIRKAVLNPSGYRD